MALFYYFVSCKFVCFLFFWKWKCFKSDGQPFNFSTWLYLEARSCNLISHLYCYWCHWELDLIPDNFFQVSKYSLHRYYIWPCPCRGLIVGLVHSKISYSYSSPRRLHSPIQPTYNAVCANIKLSLKVPGPKFRKINFL